MKRIFIFPTIEEAKAFILTQPRDPVFVAGVGAAEIAAATIRAVKAKKPQLTVLAGIAGAYDRSLTRGQVVEVVTERIAGIPERYAREYETTGPDLGLPLVAGVTVNRSGDGLGERTQGLQTEQGLQNTAPKLRETTQGCGCMSKNMAATADYETENPVGMADARPGIVSIEVANDRAMLSEAGNTEDTDDRPALPEIANAAGTGMQTPFSEVGNTEGADEQPALPESENMEGADDRTRLSQTVNMEGADDQPALPESENMESADGQPLLPEIENMEGAAFFAVCEALGVACCQIRAVSNYVGEPFGQWAVEEAVQNLTEKLTQLFGNDE